MNKYDLVLFDLDGTLTDPGAGLMKSFHYALEKMGVDYGTYESLRRFIGPPLYDTWIEEFGFTNEECDLALDHFHDYFGERGWNDNIPYDGILPMLAKVKEMGFTDSHSAAKKDLSTVKGSYHGYSNLDREIDFCFFKGADRVLTYEIISKDYAGEGESTPGFVSDHYGVMATFVSTE